MIGGMYAQAVEHYRAGRFQHAEFIVQQIRSQQAHHAGALALMGLLWHEYGRSAQAVDFIQQAIELDGSLAEAHNALATVLLAQGAADAAIVAARRAVELRPEFAETHYRLGAAFAAQAKINEAIAELHLALALKQPFPQAELELAKLLRDSGAIDEAISGFTRVLQLTGDSRVASQLLCALQSYPDRDASRLTKEFRRWNDSFARPLASQIRPHPNERSPDRRLKIGYVSPNFREHPVGRCFLPLLENHDRERFQIYCYSDVRQPDLVTEQIDLLNPLWRNILGFSDLQVAELVRADQIDILVDLTQHMEDNRLLTFARKPAPVQVTYPGYRGTTGLETMDYRLSDRYLDPDDSNQQFYSERTVRLRRYRCYLSPLQPPLYPSRAVSGEDLLMDAPGYAREVEAAFRQMWKDWCNQRS